MLDLVKAESERIDSRFLEPACGSGNFLVPVLQRKLATVHTRYNRSDFENRHFALLALMSLYGIDLLGDNAGECRENLLQILAEYLQVWPGDDWRTAAAAVLAANIVHGDALSMMTRESEPQPILFAEWSYLGKGTFKRRDFRFDTLTQMSSFGEGTLFSDLVKHQIFVPVRVYPPLSVAGLATLGSANA
jgi:hypothetical protein